MNLTHPTFVEVLVEAAEQSPDDPAFTFLDAHGDPLTWTDANLAARAHRIAGYLQSETSAGSRALLVYPQAPTRIGGQRILQPTTSPSSSTGA